MKAVLVGLGGFGSGWYRRIREQYAHIQLVAVDTDDNKRTKAEADGVPFYSSLTEAIAFEKPDIVINVTPRHKHAEINAIAFDNRLPVFSEKPIADNYPDAEAMVKQAAELNIPFMIAENYRAFPVVRKLKQLLNEGVIGTILTIDGTFNRNLERPLADKNDVLEELVVHHFDMIRYLSGREIGKLYATNRHRLQIAMELQAGITASFSCSTRSQGPQTDWIGDWRIEGSSGCAELIDKRIRLTVNGETSMIEEFGDVEAPGPFTEFLLSLEQGREAETSARDYLKNQALAHYARESIRTGEAVDASASWGYGPMIVRNFLEGELQESVSHNGKGLTRGKRLFSATDFETPIEFFGYTEIPPGASIGYHGHREDEELYIVLEGTGIMTVNGDKRRVRPGDVLLNKPWWKHGLENDGDTPIRAIIFEVKKMK